MICTWARLDQVGGSGCVCVCVCAHTSCLALSASWRVCSLTLVISFLASVSFCAALSNSSFRNVCCCSYLEPTNQTKTSSNTMMLQLFEFFISARFSCLSNLLNMQLHVFPQDGTTFHVISRLIQIIKRLLSGEENSE